jgi:hypothetical protein
LFKAYPGRLGEEGRRESGIRRRYDRPHRALGAP